MRSARNDIVALMLRQAQHEGNESTAMPDTQKIEGSCHCGQVRWRFDGDPGPVTACNCSVCRRYGVLWAYDYVDGRIAVEGETSVYSWGDRDIGFHFCPQCGNIAYWRGIKLSKDGRRRIAVNVRL